MQQNPNTTVKFLDQASKQFVESIDWDKYSSVFLLCDENTHRECWPKLKSWYPQLFNDEQLIIVEAGEEHKKLQTAEFIWRSLVDNGADRYSLLINLGGGMITDLGAFAASLYQRGIEFIHLPTSLLAMVDAAIGGKTGVDLDNLKNQIGTFNQPEAILVFDDFLETLDDEEYLSGMAEVYKHALIKDGNLWSELISIPNGRLSLQLIQKASSIKSDIVEQDPLESSIRKILNFGHTIGHAIESNFLSYGNPIPHGYAIAAGMICEAYLSKECSTLSNEDFQSIVDTLKEKYPKLEWTEEDEPEMINTMLADKKNKGGEIRMVLLQNIGDSSFDHNISKAQILAALKCYREL